MLKTILGQSTNKPNFYIYQSIVQIGKIEIISAGGYDFSYF